MVIEIKQNEEHSINITDESWYQQYARQQQQLLLPATDLIIVQNLPTQRTFAYDSIQFYYFLTLYTDF